MKKKKLKKLLKAMTKQLLLVQGGPVVKEEEQSPVLNEWLHVYQTEVLANRTYKDQTLKNHKTLLEHVTRLWGEVPINKIKPSGIYTKLRTEFLPDRSHTARRVLGELRDVFTEAVANSWAEVNPAESVKMPAHKIIRKRLKDEDFLQMLVVSETHNQKWIKVLLLLALVTGQRRADLAKMKYEDVVEYEGEGKFLRVQQQKEAGKGYGARVEIPLCIKSDLVGMTLEDVIEYSKTVGAAGPNLIRKKNGGAVEVSSLSARFGEVLVSVLGENDPGPRARPSLHEVRSLSGRVYNKQGVNVQSLLGHANQKMTDIYLNDRGLSGMEWKRVKLS
jgi:integrase